MTAWHGLEARVRRQWALLSFTRSIPIQGDGTAAFQTNFRLTFLLFLSFPLLFFFPFPFSFSSAQFLQKVNPSLFLSRAAIYVSESFSLFVCVEERVDGNYFPLFTFLSSRCRFSDGTRCWKFISKDRAEVWEYWEGMKNFSPENLNSWNAAMRTELFPSA